MKTGLSRARKGSDVRRPLWLVLVVCAVEFSHEVFAQSTERAENPVLEVVVVTARLKSESLREVPISVSALSGEVLASTQVRTFEELSYSVPSLTVNETPIDTNIFIRGIGSPENQGFEQSVGLFQDGVYWGRARQARAPFFDVERIEVLKGPQGILFGKNTSAGAINITTANPTEETEGYVSAYYEPDAEERVLEAVFSGQVADGLYARISARTVDMSGWVDNTAINAQEPNRDEQLLRATLRWEPGDNFDLTLKYSQGKLDVQGTTMQVVDAGPFGGLFQAFDPAFEDGFNEQRSVGGNGVFIAPEHSDTDNDSASLTLNWELADFRLTAITGYSGYDFNDVFDADVSALSQAQKVFNSDFGQWSQELRLFSPEASTGGIEYVIGAYWQDNDVNVETRDDIDLAALGSPAGSRYYVTHQASETRAVFGQATWYLTDVIRLNMGLRWIDEEKIARRFLRVSDLGTNNPNPALEPFFAAALGTIPHELQGARSEKQWLPSLSLQWDVSSEAMLYASFSRGFKGGGFDEQLANGSPEDWEFENEEANAYELGAKLRLLGGRAEVSGALFHTEYDDLQVSAFDGIAGFVVGNAAAATSRGLELDGRLRVNANFTLGAALTLLDAQYDDYRNAPCTAQQQAELPPPCIQDLSGETPLYSPTWAFNAFMEHFYVFGLNDGGGYELRSLLQLNATDEFALSQDLDPNLQQGSFGKLNLRISLASLAMGWELALVGKNLTNEQTASFGNDVPILNGAYFKFADRPRTLALQGVYRF
ncbi:MAG: TonB-dependent receptor [Congregibacter sp.]